jgi:3-hydroxybutyryl-CoA dehydratase
MQYYKFAELTLGQSASFDVVVTHAMVEGFLAITGDHSPIHVDDEYARRRGHSSRVVHGLLSSAFLSRLVGVHLPGAHALLQGANVTLHRPVHVGDTLTVSGCITHLNEAYRCVEIRALIHNQQSEVVVKAKLSVGVHE